MSTSESQTSNSQVIFKYAAVVLVLFFVLLWLLSGNEEKVERTEHIVQPDGIALEQPSSSLSDQISQELLTEDVNFSEDLAEPSQEVAIEQPPVEIEQAEPIQETVVGTSTVEEPPAAEIVEVEEQSVTEPEKPQAEQLFKKLAQLIVDPHLIKLIITDNAIENFVVFVDNAANGELELKYSILKAPEQKLVAESIGMNDGGEVLYELTSENYQRFDKHASLVSVLDAGLIVETYKQLHGELNSVYQQLGYPDANFEDRLITTIDLMLETPVQEQVVTVSAPSAMYVFTDPELEELLPIQKLLLRMGPENQQKIQDKLREIKAALQN